MNWATFLPVVGSVILQWNLSIAKLLAAVLPTLTSWTPLQVNLLPPEASVYDGAEYGVLTRLVTVVLWAAIETAGAARTATDVAARMSLRISVDSLS